MKTILSHLFMPLPLFFILVLAAAVTIRWKMTSRVLMLVAVVWLFTVSASPVPVLLAKNLESSYGILQAEEIELPGKQVHLLVLGGGHTNDLRLPANNRLSLQALGRLAEGIRLQRQVTGSLLITSGWSQSGKTTQAEMLSRTALLLGMDPVSVRMQMQPQNTQMEASEYKRIYGDTARLVVITSAIHMPRAIYLFRQAGLEPLAAPTNHLVKDDGRNPYMNWLPSANKIRMMESVVHEYGGLMYARFLDTRQKILFRISFMYVIKHSDILFS